MSNEKFYGIKSITFGKDKNESTLVQFGDGKTAIQSLGFDNDDVGLCLCRDGKHSEPFGYNDAKDSWKCDDGSGKVFIAFDNEKSIDVMIERLLEAKAFLKKDDGGDK